MQLSIKQITPVLTADIGGSHITAALCNMETFSVFDHSKTRLEFSSSGTAENILQSWVATFKNVLSKSEIHTNKLAIAMPGPFDYQNGISYIKGLKKYDHLYGLNIKDYLSTHLEIKPENIRFRNDAEAAIAGEVLAGAAAKYKEVAGITLGTGFGSAYFKDGITMDANWGADMYKNTIADDYFSTRWFVKRYHELTGLSVQGVKELTDLAATGNNVNARLVFTEFAKSLTDFLSAKFETLKPEALLISGNIAKANRYFVPYLTKHLQPVNIELGKLGESAALIGAAALFQPSTREDVINQFKSL